MATDGRGGGARSTASVEDARAARISRIACGSSTVGGGAFVRFLHPITRARPKAPQSVGSGGHGSGARGHCSQPQQPKHDQRSGCVKHVPPSKHQPETRNSSPEAARGAPALLGAVRREGSALHQPVEEGDEPRRSRTTGRPTDPVHDRDRPRPAASADSRGSRTAGRPTNVAGRCGDNPAHPSVGRSSALGRSRS